MALIRRLEAGLAWVLCRDCGAKLGDAEGHRDLAVACPYKRDEEGKCTNELL